ncbi:MAG: endolytic transglycosylase MltG [Lachnospiraceae bacterium]|nr:endolytic transglycosylase MltG [Lachnospiraceae bacterium]
MNNGNGNEMEGRTLFDRISVKMLKSVGIAVVYVVSFMLLLYGVIALCQKGYAFCYEIFGSVAVQEAPGREIAFQVEAADSIKSVSEKLEKKGLIVNRYSFMIRTKLMDSEKIILRPGIYLLNTSMDYGEIINQLTVSEGTTKR